MTWVKLSDTFAEDPRLEAAGTDAFVLHVAALCYCNRNLTDGHITRAATRRLWDLEDEATAVAALVREGLWEETERGYLIVEYTENQPTAERVKQQRAQSSERQARWREKKAHNASTNAVRNASTDASTNAPVDAAPTRPAPPRRKAGRVASATLPRPHPRASLRSR